MPLATPSASRGQNHSLGAPASPKGGFEGPSPPSAWAGSRGMWLPDPRQILNSQSALLTIDAFMFTVNGLSLGGAWTLGRCLRMGLQGGTRSHQGAGLKPHNRADMWARRSLLSTSCPSRRAFSFSSLSPLSLLPVPCCSPPLSTSQLPRGPSSAMSCQPTILFRFQAKALPRLGPRASSWCREKPHSPRLPSLSGCSHSWRQTQSCHIQSEA